MWRTLLVTSIALVSAAVSSTNSTADDTVPASGLDKNESTVSLGTIDLFLPVGSTTALICEPLMSEESTVASWFFNGERMVNVTSKTNAVMRPFVGKQSVPTVGLLIVNQIRKSDEGTFQCIDDSIEGNPKKGKLNRLKVAFVDRLPVEGHIRRSPRRIVVGGPLTLNCGLPHAAPAVTTTWQLNGHGVHFTIPDATAHPNGTLFIPRFGVGHLGVYTCTVSNFAGKTFTRTFIDAKDLNVNRVMPSDDETSSTCSSTFLRACLLWFLVGCLATSCLFLLYLVCAVCWCRPHRHRWVFRPSSYLRAHPSLGPGFRKPIVPLPDYYMPARTQPPPSNSSSCSSSSTSNTCCSTAVP